MTPLIPAFLSAINVGVALGQHDWLEALAWTSALCGWLHGRILERTTR